MYYIFLETLGKIQFNGVVIKHHDHNHEDNNDQDDQDDQVCHPSSGRFLMTFFVT